MAMQLSQSSQSVRLCMPLAKFSYSNVHSGSIGPIPWTHLTSRDDLFVLIDPVDTFNVSDTSEKRYRFKVLQDPNLHEDLDLTLLAYEARRAIEESRRTPSSGQQPSITIIVKVPCVAMRYPLQRGQVRRFQVRFLKEEDFYETLKVFAVIKIPFLEAGTTHGQNSNAAPQAQTVMPGRIVDPFVAPSGMTKLTNPPLQSLHSTAATISMLHSRPSQGDNSSCFATPATGQVSYDSPIARSNNPMTASQADNKPFTASLPMSGAQLVLPAFLSENTCASSLPADMTCQISTYIPRPSTAPSKVFSTSENVLPPKRDLPFQRKSERRIPPPIMKAARTVHTDACIESSATKLSSIVHETTQSTPQEEHDVDANCAKRTRAQTKKARAGNKAKRSASCKRGTASKSQDVHLPSVKGSLCETHHATDATSSESQIDTQILPENAEAIQAVRQVKKELYNLSSRTVVDNKPNNAVASVARHGESDTYEQFSTRCTSFQRDINPKSVSEAAVHNCKNSNPTIRRVPHSETTTCHRPSTDVPNPIKCQSDVQPSQPTTVNCMNQSFVEGPQLESHNQPDLATSLSLLLSDPNFAQPALSLPTYKSMLRTTPATKSASFHSKDQHTAYETFIVQNLQDDGFLDLCKTLESVWERIFVRI